ncbi:MAG: hypothetical protein IPJ84_18225 [Bdellovibrionales bacterium]|nr:hypothetical protein [Bdellovibrionales bacterium]
MALERSKQLLTMFLLDCPWSTADLGQRPRCQQSVSSVIHDDIFAMDDSDLTETGKTRTHPALVKPEPAIPSGG